jgi:hypothetical protein
MNSHVCFNPKMIENILTYEFNNYCLVDIISYVFFSSGTNRHRKELFVMAVRTPSGKTFLGNFSIIPSAKKWVFHAIFRLVFWSYMETRYAQ